MQHLQPYQFDKLLSEAKINLVMFYTDWCPFCQKFKRTFEAFASTYNDNINLCAAMINDDDNPLWNRFSINTVPTLVAFNKSKILREEIQKWDLV